MGRASEFGNSRFEHFLSLDIQIFQILPEVRYFGEVFGGPVIAPHVEGVWKTRVLKMGRLFRGSAFSFHFYEGSVWSVTRHVSPNPSSPPDCARV